MTKQLSNKPYYHFFIAIGIILALFFSFYFVSCNNAYGQKGKQQTQQPRVYGFQLPENLATQFVLLTQGHGDQVSSTDADQIRQYIVQQYLYQSRQYFIQDSIANAKQKIDTTKHK